MPLTSIAAGDEGSKSAKAPRVLRRQRRKAVATMVSGKKEPTKFAHLVELQQACDAVEWALEDEATAANERTKEPTKLQSSPYGETLGSELFDEVRPC